LSLIVYLLKQIIGQRLQLAAYTTFSPKMLNRKKCHFIEIKVQALDNGKH
jgi:hypothetical protein